MQGSRSTSVGQRCEGGWQKPKGLGENGRWGTWRDRVSPCQTSHRSQTSSLSPQGPSRALLPKYTPDVIIKFAERISFGAIDLWRFPGAECQSCECVRVRWPGGMCQTQIGKHKFWEKLCGKLWKWKQCFQLFRRVHFWKKESAHG